MPPQARHWQKYVDDDEAKGHVGQDFTVGPAWVVTTLAQIFLGQRTQQGVECSARGFKLSADSFSCGLRICNHGFR